MTDPRFSDRRPLDPDRNEPGAPRSISNRADVDRQLGGVPWNWVAGLVGAVVIVVLLVAAWSGRYTDTASITPDSSRAPMTAGSAPIRNVTPPPTTTGSGASSPPQAATARDNPARDNNGPSPR